MRVELVVVEVEFSKEKDRGLDLKKRWFDDEQLTRLWHSADDIGVSLLSDYGKKAQQKGTKTYA